MCNCYTTKCEDCETEISVHVADFCVPRSAVKVWCPACVRSRGRQPFPEGKVFASAIEAQGQLYRKGRPCGRRGDVVIFVSSNPKAYGVALD